MTTSAGIVIVGLVAAIAAYMGSVSKRTELDPIDPAAEERWLVRALASRPRLAHFVKRRLDAEMAAGLMLTLGLAAVFGLALLAGWVFDTLDRESGFAQFDRSVAEWGSANATDTSTFVLNLITDLGGTLVVSLVTIAVAFYGWFRYRSWNVAIFIISVTVGQALVNNTLKWIVERDRPAIDQLASFAGSSFPSGHSAAAAATWAGVALVLGMNARRRTRGVLAASAALIAFSVAATRALLGVHWLTDVVAGVAVGWAWFIVVAVVFGGHRMEPGTLFRQVPTAGDRTTSMPRRHHFDIAPMGLRDLGRLFASFVTFFSVGTAAGYAITEWWEGSRFGARDAAVSSWFEDRRTDLFDILTDAGSAFSDTSTVVIALLITAAVLILVTRRWHEATFLVGAVALETLAFVSIAFAVGRDRPAVAQLDVSPPTASFPSGHTAAAVALYVGLALLMRWHAEKRWTRGVAYSAAVAIPVAVAASRMYRGMHYATDVVAGALLGLASVWVLATIYRRHRPSERIEKSTAPPISSNGAASGGKIAVVANPAGANGQAKRLRRAMESRHITGDWFETTKEDPGVGQARRATASGAGVVLACGGDGTVRACIEGLAGSDATLAVMPAGTGNLLATNLAVPDGADDVLDSILEGQTTRIDIGRANGEAFAVMAGVGLDARVMRDTGRSAKDRFGVLAYVVEGLRHLSDPPVPCRVRVDGEAVFTGEAATVLVGNLGEVQSGVSLFPDSSPTDGKLDVLVIEADSPRDWLTAVWEIVTGRQGDSAPTHRFSGESIVVDLERPTPYELDGEPRLATDRISFDCTPAALAVAVPKESR